MIKLSEINRKEALRYMGSGNLKANEAMNSLMDKCEEKVLSVAEVKYLYKKIPLKESGLLLGNDIKNHLKSCENAVILCATTGAGIDRLIRTAQVTDMAEAVVLDALASCAVEQICNKLDKLIANEYSDKYLTYRFSPGYGDYPLELQGEFLRLLDAPRKIGLCTNENSLLTPTKSVTAIIGLSDKPLERKRRGCACCNLKETCKYRKTGEHCEL